MQKVQSCAVNMRLLFLSSLPFLTSSCPRVGGKSVDDCILSKILDSTSTSRFSLINLLHSEDTSDVSASASAPKNKRRRRKSGDRMESNHNRPWAGT